LRHVRLGDLAGNSQISLIQAKLAQTVFDHQGYIHETSPQYFTKFGESISPYWHGTP